MAKAVHNDVLDAALDYIKDNATKLCLCSAQPTTYTEAITTFMLAELTIDDTDFTGPADGDVSGRKLTLNAQATIEVLTTGNCTHAALVDVLNTKLLYTKTTSSEALIDGDNTSTAAADIELEDPS